MVTPSQRPPARYAWAFTHGDLIAGRVSAQQSSGRHSHCRGRGHVLMASARRHQRPGRSGAVRGAPHVRAYAPQVSLPTPPGSDALDCERPADYLAPQGRVGVRAGSLLPAWPQLGNHRTLEGVVAAHSESVEVSHDRSACGAERARQRSARDGVVGVASGHQGPSWQPQFRSCRSRRTWDFRTKVRDREFTMRSATFRPLSPIIGR
jgi:hypothetical protein